MPLATGEDGSGLASGFLHSRVVQVHPTLRCNLACSHCYSGSGPDERGEIAPDQLIAMLRLLRAEGYDVVSFSGGEPLLYTGFVEVARAAHELGYRVNLITNGLTLSPRRLDELAGVLSRVGVSIDGAQPTHDRLRGPGTFERTTRRLEHLRERGVVFGIAHCVTRESIADLPWLLGYCIEQGAALLQLHPLAAAGRAVDDGLPGLSDADLARLFLLARLFEIEADGRIQIQLDLATVEHVLACKDRYRALAELPCDPRLALSELVNPLILDERGQLWPLAHGMAANQRIAGAPLDAWPSAIETYARSNAAPLRTLLKSALRTLDGGDGFIDWYAYLVEHSRTLVSIRTPTNERHPRAL